MAISQLSSETATGQQIQKRGRSPEKARFTNSNRLPKEENNAPPQPFFIRSVESSFELDCVHKLTHDSYVERGYTTKQPDGRLIHYPHLDQSPNTTVLIALQSGHIIGTNSLTLDGPQGLHTDFDFKPECDQIRSEGRRMASSWRIATCPKFRGETRLVMELIRATVHEFVRLGVETSVFTFHPRHERVYQRLVKLETVARHDGIKHLSNAPAVLMRWDREKCPKRWLPSA